MITIADIPTAEQAREETTENCKRWANSDENQVLCVLSSISSAIMMGYTHTEIRRELSEYLRKYLREIGYQVNQKQASNDWIVSWHPRNSESKEHTNSISYIFRA